MKAKLFRYMFRHGYWTPIGDVRRWFRPVLLRLWVDYAPRRVLSPRQQFERDGWNDILYRSAELKSRDSVLIFGAHLGESTLNWRTKFPETVLFCYEPEPSFAKACSQRFANDINVTVFPYGLGEKTESRKFWSAGIMTTGLLTRTFDEFFPPDSKTVEVAFRSVEEEIRNWPSEIGVVEINIEGGEYELIEALHSAGALPRFRQVFLQFHDVGDESSSLVDKARQHLAKSHRQVFCYPFVWELWNRH